MSFAEELDKVIKNAKSRLEKMEETEKLVPTEMYGENGVPQDHAANKGFVNLLAQGENLKFMLQLCREEDMAGKVDLIYIDPPFFSKARYSNTLSLLGKNLKQEAYEDNWHDLWEYLEMLCMRLMVAKELLAETGSIWVHLDWHSAHYAKIIMDEIFGMDNFVNEIIWHYKSGGSGKKNFSRKHDTLLFYSKSKKYFFNPLEEKSYNRGMKPYRFKGVKEYEDEIGWYTLVNMKDVWNIDMVGRTSAERTGYATQKPEMMLSRIIESCSREGDLVADFFGGSGSFAIAAAKKGRRWISCDFGMVSAGICKKRFIKERLSFQVWTNQKVWESKAENETGVEVLKLCNIVVESWEKEYIIKIEKIEIDSNILKRFFNRSVVKNSISVHEVENILEKIRMDSRLLIDSWSFDSEYDGCIHRGDRFYQRAKGSLEYESMYHKPELDNERKRYDLSVIYTDIFGNTYREVLRPE